GGRGFSPLQLLDSPPRNARPRATGGERQSQGGAEVVRAISKSYRRSLQGSAPNQSRTDDGAAVDASYHDDPPPWDLGQPPRADSRHGAPVGARRGARVQEQRPQRDSKRGLWPSHPALPQSPGVALDAEHDSTPPGGRDRGPSRSHRRTRTGRS